MGESGGRNLRRFGGPAGRLPGEMAGRGKKGSKEQDPVQLATGLADRSYQVILKLGRGVGAW